MAAFERTWPLEKLSIEAVGRTEPVGNMLRKPFAPGFTITTDIATAVGELPMPHRPAVRTRRMCGVSRR